MIEMAIEIARRLTVREQLSRNQAFKGMPLAVSAKFPSGRQLRAGEVLKNLPLLLASGILVEIRTLEGNLLDPVALIGKTPKQIDSQAARLDSLLSVDLLRKAGIQHLPELVRIEAGALSVAGSLLFGKKKPNAANIAMSGFYAGKYPVMVSEYREFVEAAGYNIAGDNADELMALLADQNKDRHPVVFVNHADRVAYAMWLREKTGDNWFILSAAQQEFIRRGSSGRAYPLGNDWREAPYYNQDKTASVDAWPEGTTPDGVSGLGIVWEATRSYYGDYDEKIVKNPEGQKSGDDIEVRGGSAWGSRQVHFVGACRSSVGQGGHYGGIGFRLGRT